MRLLSLFVCAVLMMPTVALAQLQAGSIGGTIGKTDKSATGGPSETRQQGHRSILLRAAAFTRSSGIQVGGVADWGLTSIHNSAPYLPKLNVAEYDFAAATGHYMLEVEYASADSRPVEVSVNGAVVTTTGLSAATGGFSDQYQRWSSLGIVELKSGRNTLRFKQDSYFPHIRTIRFVPQ
jgi:hypothetical protein